MKTPRARPIALALCITTLSALGAAHADAPLSDYVGTYSAPQGGPLEIVAGSTLFAVIDEAKYPLTRVQADTFLARSGDRVVFNRDAKGMVQGIRAQGVQHERLSAQVSKAAADLAWPRPQSPGFAATWRYEAPAALADGIHTGAAPDSGLNPAALERVVQGVLDGSWPDVHSVLVHHRGRLVLEQYFYGYSVQRPHQMRSATKSVVSLLAGIAAARPGGAQLDTPVFTRLPYTDYANADPRKPRITLEQLLTMRSGLACNDWDAKSPGNESKLYESPDWVKATLDLPMETDPGGTARYCSGAVAVVGRVTERAMNTSLPEFAQAALFGPLGVKRSDWRWNYQLDNSNREYSQIHLRPRDLLKIGLLFANGGAWQGQQIVPAAWVRASLEPHADLGGNGYGYFWWRRWLDVPTASGTQRISFSAAQGNGGQRILLLPQFELVVVFTGGDYNSGSAPPNRIMASVILPALLGAGAAASR